MPSRAATPASLLGHAWTQRCSSGHRHHRSAIQHRCILWIACSEERHEGAGGDDPYAFSAELIEDGAREARTITLPAEFEWDVGMPQNHSAILDAVIGNGRRILRDREFVSAHGPVVDEF